MDEELLFKVQGARKRGIPEDVIQRALVKSGRVKDDSAQLSMPLDKRPSLTRLIPQQIKDFAGGVFANVDQLNKPGISNARKMGELVPTWDAASATTGSPPIMFAGGALGLINKADDAARMVGKIVPKVDDAFRAIPKAIKTLPDIKALVSEIESLVPKQLPPIEDAIAPKVKAMTKNPLNAGSAKEAIAKGLTEEQFVKGQGTPVFHGTSSENATKISQEGFRAGAGKGVSGQGSSDFVYATGNKPSADRYVADRLGIKNPTVVDGNFNGKVLEIEGKMADFEAFGEASKKLGVSLGKDSQGNFSMLDMSSIKKAMKEQGYSAIGFSDRYANGTKAFAILPDQIKTSSQLRTEYQAATQATGGVQEAIAKGLTEEQFVKGQGTPFEKTLYRGSGSGGGLQARADIGNAFGEGKYYASVSQAARYGKNIEEKVVKLNNPLIIKTDQELRNITGGSNLVVSEKAGITPQMVKKQIEETRKRIIEMGHDGVVVEMANYQDTQNLRRLFEHDQVIDYGIKSKSTSQLRTEYQTAKGLSKPSSAQQAVKAGLTEEQYVKRQGMPKDGLIEYKGAVDAVKKDFPNEAIDLESPSGVNNFMELLDNSETANNLGISTEILTDKLLNRVTKLKEAGSTKLVNKLGEKVTSINQNYIDRIKSDGVRIAGNSGSEKVKLLRDIYGGTIPREIKIYRGTNLMNAPLRVGDYVTPSKSLARGYVEGEFGNVANYTVKSEDLILMRVNSGGFDSVEMVYLPKARRADLQIKTTSQLRTEYQAAKGVLPKAKTTK